MAGAHDMARARGEVAGAPGTSRRAGSATTTGADRTAAGADRTAAGAGRTAAGAGRTAAGAGPAAIDWSDIRIFLAIARAGTLGGAARAIGQTQPTMGRRLRALEAAAGQALFQRTRDGLVLTDEGHALLGHAERMEDEALAAGRWLAGAGPTLEGMVRISCAEWYGVTALAPIVAELAQLHPGIVVELVTDARLYSLPRREADLVIRNTPFNEPEVIARPLCQLTYAAYLRTGLPRPRRGDGAGTALVVMDTAFGGLPDVAWLTRTLPRARIASRSNNREVQAALCALGVGLAVLPRPLGDTTPAITPIDLGEPPPSRQLWLGFHRDLRRLARLRAVIELIVARLGS